MESEQSLSFSKLNNIIVIKFILTFCFTVQNNLLNFHFRTQIYNTVNRPN